MRILGLDVSSTCTGVTILEGDARSFVRVHMSHIDLTKKCDDIWDKIDVVRSFLDANFRSGLLQNIDHVGIEEALISFRPGMSSAQTITTLVRMNMITAHLVRDIVGLTPQFIPAPTARKLCGIRTQQVKKCGKPVKQQVFDHMLVHDLSDMRDVWPKKKQTEKAKFEGKPEQYRSFCYDQADSFVVAKATLLLHG